jgi:hypothetical protein
MEPRNRYWCLATADLLGPQVVTAGLALERRKDPDHARRHDLYRDLGVRRPSALFVDATDPYVVIN